MQPLKVLSNWGFDALEQSFVLAESLQLCFLFHFSARSG